MVFFAHSTGEPIDAPLFVLLTQRRELVDSTTHEQVISAKSVCKRPNLAGDPVSDSQALPRPRLERLRVRGSQHRNGAIAHTPQYGTRCIKIRTARKPHVEIADSAEDAGSTTNDFGWPEPNDQVVEAVGHVLDRCRSRENTLAIAASRAQECFDVREPCLSDEKPARKSGPIRQCRPSSPLSRGVAPSSRWLEKRLVAEKTRSLMQEESDTRRARIERTRDAPCGEEGEVNGRLSQAYNYSFHEPRERHESRSLAWDDCFGSRLPLGTGPSRQDYLSGFGGDVSREGLCPSERLEAWYGLPPSGARGGNAQS